MNPKLIHPVAVEITQIDPAATEQDDVWRQPAAASPTWKEPVELNGQVSYARVDRLTPQPGGDRPAADGHVTFRMADLAPGTAALEPKKGDRITKVAGTVRDWLIVEVAPAGHYPNAPTLVRAYFQKRIAP